jgi:hypothetical protein
MEEKAYVPRSTNDILCESLKDLRTNDISDYVLDGLMFSDLVDPIYTVTNFLDYVPKEIAEEAPLYGSHFKTKELYDSMDQFVSAFKEAQPYMEKLGLAMEKYLEESENNYKERQKDPFFKKWEAYAKRFRRRKRTAKVDEDMKEFLRENKKQKTLE